MPGNEIWSKETGSIIVVLATDAPLLPTQLERVARRASIGIGRGGTPSGNNSGDIFVAFSTANDPGPLPDKRRYTFDAIGNDVLDGIFLAAVEAVEESVLNALIAAETMTGKHGRRVEAMDHAELTRLAGVRPR
jgi:L-aminopeptidase/D-esterase-like protein